MVRDLCRSGCRQNYYLIPPLPPSLPPFLPIFIFWSLPTILSLIQMSVIWNQRAWSWFRCCLAVIRYWSTWEKFPVEHHVKLWDEFFFFFSGVKTTKVVRRPCDSTSGNLNKSSVRKKSRGVYLPIGWVFSSHSIIFRLICNKREKIMRGCG